jgi:hypothetical protein
MLIKIHAMKIKEPFEISFTIFPGVPAPPLFLLPELRINHFFIHMLQGKPAGPDTPCPGTTPLTVLNYLSVNLPLPFEKGTGNNPDEFLFPAGKPTDSGNHTLIKNVWQPVLMPRAQ